jgi:hypothetical protein
MAKLKLRSYNNEIVSTTKLFEWKSMTPGYTRVKSTNLKAQENHQLTRSKMEWSAMTTEV